jgi:hypothetical protein
VIGSDCVQDMPGNGLTFTDADRLVDPETFVQLIAYVVVSPGVTEYCPDAPNDAKPVPVQAIALFDDHESVETAPGVMLAGLALNERVGAVDDAASRLLWVVHPVRSSLKDTSHHVIESALTGPPMTVPWFPCASSPIGFVPVDAVDQT